MAPNASKSLPAMIAVGGRDSAISRLAMSTPFCGVHAPSKISSRLVALDPKPPQRGPVPGVALFNHWPRDFRGDERDALMVPPHEVFNQADSRLPIVGGDRGHKAARVPLEEHHVSSVFECAIDVPTPESARSGQHQENTVDALLHDGLKQLFLLDVRTSGMNQEGVTTIANHVADPRNDHVGHRIGQELTLRIKYQEPKRL